MKTLMSFVLFTSCSMLIFAHQRDESFWSLGGDECDHQGEVLSCDYRGKGKSIVHYEDPANSSIKQIVISNSHEVLITRRLCKDLELRNVSKISIIQEKYSVYHSNEFYYGCTKGGKLSVYDSELVNIPFGLREFSVKNSIIDHFGPSVPRNFDIRHSHVKMFNVTVQTDSGTIGLIYNSTIDTLVSMKIESDYTLSIQNSFINRIHQKAIIVKEGNLEFNNTLIKSACNDSVLLMANISIELDEFDGYLALKVPGNRYSFMESLYKNESLNTRSLESVCVADDAYFKAFLCVLALFTIMTLLFLLQVILKRRIIKSTLSSTTTEFPTASGPERNPDTPLSPLLLEITDRGQCSPDEVDEFEDELLKVYEVTKALYLEDIDDIESEMQTTLDSRRKEEFDDFFTENMKLPELQEFQTKRSQIDKHTEVMERMNQTVKELIKTQYQNHSFNLQNSGNDLIIKYKEIMVECNHRLLDDLTEIIKRFISKLDDELREEKNHSSSMISYIRNLLAKLSRSTDQLTGELERLSSKCKKDYETSLRERKDTYKSKIEAISACAEERSDLLKGTEQEDTEVYGGEKALKLSLLQEEISFASQELRQKEALLDFSQDNQKLLHQEHIIRHQTDNIRHLERIIMTLSDIRRCYILVTRSSWNTNISQEKEL